MRGLKKQAMQKVRDATDASGGAKFPTYMLENMKQWEKEGLLELHDNGNVTVARITDKGRKFAA